MIQIDKTDSLFVAFPALLSQRENIASGAEMMIAAYRSGGKILLAGNGGSAADCEHIQGELLKGFLSKRRMSEKSAAEFDALYPDEHFANYLQGGIPAISLPSFSALNSAFSNDVSADFVYAQTLYALARPGDMLIAISTSGNSKSVCLAAKTAKVLGIPILGLTGKDGGILADICDITIRVPESETYRVQEYHLPVYHRLCAEAEKEIFGGNI